MFDAARGLRRGGVPALAARDGPDPPGGRRGRERSSAGSPPVSGARALPQAARGERPHAQDRFLLLYTSGTTSAPKGVPVAYRRFLPNAARSAEELGIDETSVLLSAAPFTHLYGLFSLHLALAAGAATALLPAYSPADFARALDRDRPTGLFVAPAHMAACLAEGLLTRARLATVRFVLISGSACPPDLAQAVQERMPNGEVLQLWGMSELQAGSFTRPGDEPRVRFGTAGRASPGTELRVALDGAPAPPGVEGELQVRGPSVFDGYLDNAEATADAFTSEGWFRTGDLTRMDEHGNIQITGRSKDVINRGGVKFNAADVEALLARHPGVASCAIVPTPDSVLGERACCFVVLKPQADGLRLEDLCRWLADHGVAKVKWPERLEIVDEMPMTRPEDHEGRRQDAWRPKHDRPDRGPNGPYDRSDERRVSPTEMRIASGGSPMKPSGDHDRADGGRVPAGREACGALASATRPASSTRRASRIGSSTPSRRSSPRCCRCRGWTSAGRTAWPRPWLA